jgi:hypothetical protein
MMSVLAITTKSYVKDGQQVLSRRPACNLASACNLIVTSCNGRQRKLVAYLHATVVIPFGYMVSELQRKRA